MAFYLQGLGGHELMPAGTVFKKPGVQKAEAYVEGHAIDENEHNADSGSHEQQRAVAQTYQSVDQLPQDKTVVTAEQVMTSPVVVLSYQATVNEALLLMREKTIRHLPVVSTVGSLVGIISDRDIFRHLSGAMENSQFQALHNRSEPIAPLIKSPVLTASKDTDVRYIARLFVEQHAGALPIVEDGKLTGIVSRSDVLSAVTRHFILQLWA